MCHRKGGDGLKEHHAALDDQQQAEDKEQVIDALHDVMEAKADILARRDKPRTFSAKLRIGFCWKDDRRQRGAVQTVHANKDIRDSALKAGKADDASFHTFVPTVTTLRKTCESTSNRSVGSTTVFQESGNSRRAGCGSP